LAQPIRVHDPGNGVPTKVGSYRINGPAMTHRINDLTVGLLLVGAIHQRS